LRQIHALDISDRPIHLNLLVSGKLKLAISFVRVQFQGELDLDFIHRRQGRRILLSFVNLKAFGGFKTHQEIG